eukprot:TRINITY_DN58801_c0_g1_i1.p1 TRINITY_DN58801_c0_g1~~TRINITY_DN58801_c0_g1_i1.p1  ORF type:complete len:645 (-),score=129.36 TRINITY_DN58801_c0_g1_i1:8-1942(-)
MDVAFTASRLSTVSASRWSEGRSTSASSGSGSGSSRSRCSGGALAAVTSARDESTPGFVPASYAAIAGAASGLAVLMTMCRRWRRRPWARSALSPRGGRRYRVVRKVVDRNEQQREQVPAVVAVSGCKNESVNGDYSLTRDEQGGRPVWEKRTGSRLVLFYSASSKSWYISNTVEEKGFASVNSEASLPIGLRWSDGVTVDVAGASWRSGWRSQRLRAGTRRADETMSSLLCELQDIYAQKLQPLERRLQFSRFYDSPDLSEAYFSSKPMILLVGGYSTGKSTLINKLLGTDYPGVKIGPEPTTDKFVAVMSGASRQLVPGFALCSDPSKPFSHLERFGSSFLERLEGAILPVDEAPALESFTFIDTPGVLSGDKQRVGRSYDFEGVIGWFAENADLVLVLFDPNKLDVSDEFRRCLEALGRSERKVRFVLNKANRLSGLDLVRVYGALMWSLSRIITTPEMVRAYVTSFSGQGEDGKEPVAADKSSESSVNEQHFLQEEEALLQEVSQAPLDNTTRKVNDLLRRGRKLRCHALIVNQLAKSVGFLGSRRKLREVTGDPDRLADVFEEVALDHEMPLQDFPSAVELSDKFAEIGDDTVKKVPQALLADAQSALTESIPLLMERVAAERERMYSDYSENALKAKT